MKALAAILAALTLCACGDVEVAKRAARSYAADLGYEVRGVSCTGFDTDGDGYVSCSVHITEQPEPLTLECTSGSAFTFSDGCKLAPTLKVAKGVR